MNDPFLKDQIYIPERSNRNSRIGQTSSAGSKQHCSVVWQKRPVDHFHFLMVPIQQVSLVWNSMIRVRLVRHFQLIPPQMGLLSEAMPQ